MSEHRENLQRASTLINRIASVGGMQEFDGVLLADIAADCALAANKARIEELRGEIFACNPDESAGMAEIVELHGYSKKAPCA